MYNKNYIYICVCVCVLIERFIKVVRSQWSRTFQYTLSTNSCTINKFQTSTLFHLLCSPEFCSVTRNIDKFFCDVSISEYHHPKRDNKNEDVHHSVIDTATKHCRPLLYAPVSFAKHSNFFMYLEKDIVIIVLHIA